MERPEARKLPQTPDPKQRAAELRGLSGVSADTLAQARAVGRETNGPVIRLETKSQESLGALSPSAGRNVGQAGPAERERFIQKEGTQLGRPSSGPARDTPSSIAAKYRGPAAPAKAAGPTRESLGTLRPGPTPARTPAREARER